MATSQDQDIQALPEFQRDHETGELNGIVSDRDTELVAAIMFIENAIRAFGVNPEALQGITKDSEPKETPDNVIGIDAEISQRAAEANPANTYEEMVSRERDAAKIPGAVVNEEPRLADIRSLVDHAHNSADQPISPADNEMPQAAGF